VKLPEWLREIAGWAGLLLVVSCGFVVPASAHYPGYIALWPTLGAALVLLSGSGRTRFGVERVLAWKPLVAMGEISFSFYLWHWPALTFALLISGKTQLGLQAGLAVIAIALCGAFVSARWLEQPMQRSSIGQRKAWHIYAMSAALALPVVILATGWTIFVGSREKDRGFSIADYPGGSIPASRETMVKHGVPLKPDIAVAKRDIAKVFLKDCHQNQNEAEVTECYFGNLNKPTKTVAIVGGSHSSHWFPALEIIAERYGWRIVNITKSACPFMMGGGNSSCMEWNKNVVASIARLKPDVVFTTSTRSRLVNGKREEYVPEGYKTQWSRLAEIGVRIIAVRDNPWLGFHVAECIEAKLNDIMACSRPRTQVLNHVDPSLELPTKPVNVDFIDMTDRFCDQSTCFSVSGNVIIYSDRNHFTVTFARTMASALEQRMKEVRPDLLVPGTESEMGAQRNAEAGQ
jgi:hypothetical protein